MPAGTDGNNPDAIRVLVAAEQTMFREVITGALEAEDDFEVVAQVSDGKEALELAERARPDVALLDAELANADGIAVASSIASRVRGCRVMVVATEGDQHTLLRSMEAGASGYLTRSADLTELIEGARAVHRGETLIPPQMLGALIRSLVHRRWEHNEAFGAIRRLTSREREVLALLAAGADNDRIAQRLVISPQTARTHIQNLLTKLGVHSRLEAVAFVTRNGFLAELEGAER